MYYFLQRLPFMCISFVEWRKESDYFVSTRASKETMNLIQTKTCVAVTGSSGSGKSSIVHHVALCLHGEGYDIHIVDEPSQIFHNYQSKKNQLFVLDDPFGKNTERREQIPKWEAYLDKLKTIMKIDDNAFKRMITGKLDEDTGKTIVLISCRLHLYKTNILSPIVKSLQFHECNLHLDTLDLTKSEKKDTFDRYVRNVMFESVECDLDCFPMVCMLAFDKDPETVKRIFQNPPRHIMEDIKNMKQENKFQFCCICLCVMFDPGFNLNILRNWSSINENKTKHLVLKFICKDFKINLKLEIERSEILDTFSILTDSYCKVVGDMIAMKHDKIYDIAANICGNTLFHAFLTYASPKFISQRYTFHYLSQG